ncbi:Rhodanese-like domain-containing protein [Dunaliella salina]|uniref:Rhodanese-like domain-containing protein n=1 Tax=Dunaliella salina TaxID=3046 RepID=A0ABQ7GAZ4_DUNSA|nr:Rhodanese-like domain-containing protein [Dunaliella salina]|eukprot:KAF5831780.1 Rhodanese-like domain-containing protein [Dunaliella salina]
MATCQATLARTFLSRNTSRIYRNRIVHRRRARARALVDPRWLDASMQDVSILDVRPYTEYLEGHIPHAVHLNLADLGFEGGTESLCTDPSSYIPLLEARGVDGVRPAVVYDSGEEYQAALAWWALAVFGHSQCHVLQGGFKEWLTEQGKEELYEPCPLKLSTQFEASDEPQLHLVTQPSSATSYAVEVSMSLATYLRDNPPKDLGTFRQAIQQHMPTRAPDLEHASISDKPISFLALSVHELPYACYVAMWWDALSGQKPWAVGCV